MARLTGGYKFLRSGAVGPFSGFAWPDSGEWVEARGSREPCREGVHALEQDALAEWLDDELWRVELDGDLERIDGVLVADRGRLVSRVEGWDERAAAGFAEACVRRLEARAGEDERSREYAAVARAIADGGRAADPRYAPLVGFVLRHAAEEAEQGGWQRELVWQSRLLAERVGL